MTFKTFTAEVEVSLDDFDDDDIAEAYELRCLGDVRDHRDLIEEMFYAFKLGKTGRAMELARQIAQEATGRIL